MVPVTTACVNGPALPATVGDSHDMVHLNLGLRGEWIGLILDAVLGVDQPVVTSVLRTGDLTSPAAHAALVENLERLAEHPRIAERSFTDPAGAVASFRRRARRIVAPGH
jgi:hypothetical protein